MNNNEDDLTKEEIVNKIKELVEKSIVNHNYDFNRTNVDKYSEKIIDVFNRCKEKHADLKVKTNSETGESVYLKDLEMVINNNEDITISNMLYISLVERK